MDPAFLDYSFQWERCGSDLRSAAMLADAPVGHWPRGDLHGDVHVPGPVSGALASAFTFEAWVEPGEAQAVER